MPPDAGYTCAPGEAQRIGDRQILAIDLLRFACALLVVAHHYAAILPLHPPAFAAHVPVASDWAGWSWAGCVGVELFFVVSGYVIAISAERGSAGAFARRRALRLLPAAWLCASVTTVVAIAAGVHPAPDAVSRWCASLIFFPFAPEADPSSWTLGVEISFYLLVTASLGKEDNRQRLDGIAAALAAVSGAYWIAREAGIIPLLDWTILDLALLTHGAFFALGMALWAIGAGAKPLRLFTIAAGGGAAVLEITAQSRFMSDGLGLAQGPALPLAIFGAGLALIVFAKPLQGPLAGIFGARRLAAVGLATYPLYLLHQQTGMLAIVTLRGAGVGSHAAMLLTAAAMIGSALFVALRLEPPLRRWLAARIDAFSRRGPRPDTLRSASLPGG